MNLNNENIDNENNNEINLESSLPKDEYISSIEDNSTLNIKTNTQQEVQQPNINVYENVSQNNTNFDNQCNFNANHSQNTNMNYNKKEKKSKEKTIIITIVIILSCLLLFCCCGFASLFYLPFFLAKNFPTIESQDSGAVGNYEIPELSNLPNLHNVPDTSKNDLTISKEEDKNVIEESNVSLPTIDTQVNSTKTFEEKEDMIVDIVEETYPTVVSIVTAYNVNQTTNDSFLSEYMEGLPAETYGYASGVIIEQTDTELIVVTNAHVVSDMSLDYGYMTLSEEYKSATVTFANNKQASAYLKGMDVENDIAIIAIPLVNLSEDTLDDIKIATLGNSSELRLGESVLAIGNPLGGGLSVTKGIVSALDVLVVIEDSKYKAIQTDAAINPGNSGGGLFNLQGELIAINSSKSADDGVEGMGYAIPISNITNLIKDLSSQEGKAEDIEYALSTKGGLGISCFTVDEEIAKENDIPMGIYVGEVKPNYPAYKDGLMPNDIITKMNETEYKTVEELIAQIQTMNFGDKVVLELLRFNEKTEEWEKFTLVTTLGKENK